jgi:hypothetical protein
MKGIPFGLTLGVLLGVFEAIGKRGEDEAHP